MRFSNFKEPTTDIAISVHFNHHHIIRYNEKEANRQQMKGRERIPNWKETRDLFGEAEAAEALTKKKINYGSD